MSAGQPQIKGLQLLRDVAAQAIGNAAYREQLLKEPVTVLSKAGLTVQNNVQVFVHANTATEVHLVLPTQQDPKLDPNETNVVVLANKVHL
jgi:hypothetical protein